MDKKFSLCFVFMACFGISSLSSSVTTKPTVEQKSEYTEQHANNYRRGIENCKQWLRDSGIGDYFKTLMSIDSRRRDKTADITFYISKNLDSEPFPILDQGIHPETEKHLGGKEYFHLNIGGIGFKNVIWDGKKGYMLQENPTPHIVDRAKFTIVFYDNKTGTIEPARAELHGNKDTKTFSLKIFSPDEQVSFEISEEDIQKTAEITYKEAEVVARSSFLKTDLFDPKQVGENVFSIQMFGKSHAEKFDKVLILRKEKKPSSIGRWFNYANTRSWYYSSDRDLMKKLNEFYESARNYPKWAVTKIIRIIEDKTKTKDERNMYSMDEIRG